MKTRIIHYTYPAFSGREGIFFTEDFDAEADEFLPVGAVVYSDTVIEFDKPMGFPMEWNLEK